MFKSFVCAFGLVVSLPIFAQTKRATPGRELPAGSYIATAEMFAKSPADRGLEMTRSLQELKTFDETLKVERLELILGERIKDNLLRTLEALPDARYNGRVFFEIKDKTLVLIGSQKNRILTYGFEKITKTENVSMPATNLSKGKYVFKLKTIKEDGCPATAEVNFTQFFAQESDGKFTVKLTKSSFVLDNMMRPLAAICVPGHISGTVYVEIPYDQTRIEAPHNFKIEKITKVVSTVKL